MRKIKLPWRAAIAASGRGIAVGVALVVSINAWGAEKANGPSVAINYSAKAPLNELKAFDIVVVEPEHGYNPQKYRRSYSQLYAYISIGEVQPSRSYFKDIPRHLKLSENKDWGSVVIDQSKPEWSAFFADRIVAPLWAQGYRGFFIDTMDSYRLAKGFVEDEQQRGIIRTIEGLHQKFPGIQLITNRGFEVMPALAGKVQMIAAESLFKGWHAGKRRYQDVRQEDREWLLGQLNAIKTSLGIPVLVIDYVHPSKRRVARETAAAISKLGFIPWVTDSDLSTVGVGSVEVVPRRIAVVYDGREAPTVIFSNVHRYLEMPANYLGYVFDYFDVNKPLPSIESDRYAGVVSWFSGGVVADKSRLFGAWIAARQAAGMPIAMLDTSGVQWVGGLSEKFGIAERMAAKGRIEIVRQDSMLGFEVQPKPVRDLIQPMVSTNPKDRILIAVRDEAGHEFTGGAITSWGGYIQAPFVIDPVVGTEFSRWVIDPFSFLADALKLRPIPVPDTTTENGLRLLLSHVDGDGFPSQADFPGSPLAAEVLYEQILKKVNLPITMSVIEGEIAPHGLYPKLSKRMEESARKMFSLPNVEIGSHSFSHPFKWDRSYKHGIFSEGSDAHYGLEIPGYEFDPIREVVGSIAYIRDKLAPKGKPVRVMQWTGDTSPGDETLRVTEEAGVLNINGGDTFPTYGFNTLTAVRSVGIERAGGTQIFAPITNENIYTNLWTGPFYGFKSVLETFEITDAPRRIKPVNIYYHTYSASKPSALKVLTDVYRWAENQPFNAVFTSEFIEKANDFFLTSIALDGDKWQIRTDGHLRTLRLPKALHYPNLATAEGVAGVAPAIDGQYVHIASDSANFATSTDLQVNGPYLKDANGRIGHWAVAQSGRGLNFSLHGHRPVAFQLGNAKECEVLSNGKRVKPTQNQRFMLRENNAKIVVSCSA